jgi:putative heme-binding domain-containing protein
MRDVETFFVYNLLGTAEDTPAGRAEARDLLRGTYEAVRGQTELSGPPEWHTTLRRLARFADPEIHEKALLLSVLFGDRESMASLRRTAADTQAEIGTRQTALQTLVEAKAPDLQSLLRDLLADAVMRGPALRALAAPGDTGTPALILKHYAGYSDAEKADAIATLASRPAWALALLDAMEHGDVPRRDLSPFTARQLLGLKDKQLSDRLTRVWGTIRATAQDRTALMSRYLSLVAPAALKKADRVHGRQVFARTCATCHTLFGEGGKIGPDLTGSQRQNPEYVLSKVLDPNAVVSRDYQMTVIATAAGRTLNGLVKSEDDRTVTLQTQNEVVRVPKVDIEERHRSPVSMMPEGQLGPMSDAEVRDLIAYLAGHEQAPLTPSPPP